MAEESKEESKYEKNEKLFRSFLISLVQYGLDLTKMVKANLINNLEIVPLLIGELRGYKNGYVADALFLLKTKNEKAVKIVRGEIRVDDPFISVFISDIFLDVDIDKIERGQ